MAGEQMGDQLLSGTVEKSIRTDLSPLTPLGPPLYLDVGPELLIQ
jgi:hypothetical protein